MKLSFIADVHLANHRIMGGPMLGGLNDRARLIAGAIREAARHASSIGSDILVGLGDLFDVASPSPMLEAAMIEALSGGPDRRLLVGNHDQFSDTPGDHALAPLAFVKDCRVLESPLLEDFGDVQHWMVPYRSGRAMDWLPGVLEVFAVGASAVLPKRRVLSVHLGIHDSGLRSANFWAEAAHDAISVEQLRRLCEQYGIDAVFAGNWHARKCWSFGAARGDLNIVQVGALVPTGWDNPGVEGYGSVATYDSTTNSVQFAEVPGPRFMTVRSQDELDDAVLEVGIHNRLFVRWLAEPSAVDGALAALEVADVASFDVRIDKSAMKAAATQAAAAARAHVTMEASLVAFIAEMPLPDNVGREDVLRECRQYLRLTGL